LCKKQTFVKWPAQKERPPRGGLREQRLSFSCAWQATIASAFLDGSGTINFSMLAIGVDRKVTPLKQSKQP
jgi:hypothetical protein